jgi:hypothetical protein
MRIFIDTDTGREYKDRISSSKLSISKMEDKSGITLSIINCGNSPVLIHGGGLSVELAADEFNEDTVIFIDPGKCAWAGVRRLKAPAYDKCLQVAKEQRTEKNETHVDSFHSSNLQTVLYNDEKKSAFLMGFLAQKTGVGTIKTFLPDNKTGSVTVEAWQEVGRRIKPSEEIVLDCIKMMKGSNPYSLLEKYADLVNESIKRSFDGPPIVGMMTWYGYHAAVTEDIVIENGRIISEFFDGYPQEMQKLMLVDHGWQNEAEWGDIKPDPIRFSHGIEWLSERLAKMGLELGIWHTPFCITEFVQNYSELKSLVAADLKGEKKEGVASVWNTFDFKDRGGSRKINYFDASHPKVLERWKSEMRVFKEQGCSYCKLDFFVLEKDESKGEEYSKGELYNLAWNSLRDGFGKDRHLAPCSCETNMQLGYCDSIRIASDIGEAGSWPGAYEKYRYGHSTIASLWYKNRKFWVNDPDSLQVAKGCSMGEARIRAATIALAGGHVMLSEDLRLVSPERLEIVRRILPPIKKAAVPINLFENPFPEGCPSMWRLEPEWESGPSAALALFNFEKNTKKFIIDPDMVGIDMDCEFIVLEWWQGRWLGKFNGQFTVDVPPEDCAVLHAKPLSSEPCIVSVSHHITGGYILNDVKFNAKTCILAGEILTKPGIDMVLYGYLPSGWKISSAERGHTILNSLGGWQSEIKTSSRKTTFSILFEREVR